MHKNALLYLIEKLQNLPSAESLPPNPPGYATIEGIAKHVLKVLISVLNFEV